MFLRIVFLNIFVEVHTPEQTSFQFYSFGEIQISSKKVVQHQLLACPTIQQLVSPRSSSFFFFFKWANPGLFFVYFHSFQTNIVTILSIQYTVPGFEPLRTRVSSHYHQTRAPVLFLPSNNNTNKYYFKINSTFPVEALN